MLYALLNSLGLVLTVAGAGVLWWVTPVFGGGPSYWADEEVLAQIRLVTARKERSARCGFALIAVGTLVQLVTLWVPTLHLL